MLYLAMSSKMYGSCYIIERALPWVMPHSSSGFYGNLLSSFCVIMLINKQTDKQKQMKTVDSDLRQNSMGFSLGHAPPLHNNVMEIS